MSVQTLYSAATGMISMETKIDVLANNLANVETTGYKAGRTNFEDLYYRNERFPGSQDSAGQYTPVGIQIGLGSGVQSVQTDMEQGAFKQTGRELDWLVEGKGYFQVVDPPTGNIYYTRAGNFSLNANGDIVVGSSQTGRLLEPGISIPPDTTAITVSPEGIVSVKQPASPTLAQVGQIELAYFINPEGLLRLGENLLAETDASGPPTTASPGQDSVGVVRQGALEASNVQPIEELIDLITTQRAYEMNSQVVKAGDQMLEIVANLRRY